MSDTTAPADGARAPEKNTEIPVQTSAPEPLIVAKDEPAKDEGAVAAEPADGAAIEPAADGAADEGDGSKKPAKVPEWLQKKMAADAFEARETARKLKAAEEELAKFKAPKPAAPNAADAAAAEQAAPAGGYKSPAEFDAAVQAEADRRAQQERAAQEAAEFDAACNTAYTKGKSDPTIGEHFDAAVGNLQQLGFMNREMLDLVLGTDDPSKVLYDLGSDPDKAAAIMALPPAKRAIEIAKMSVAVPVKAAPTPLSKAPRPVDTVEGSARPNSDPADNDDDATWFAKRNAQIQRRYQGAA